MIGDEEVTVTENGVESSLDPPLQLTATEYGTEGPKIIINFKNDNGNRDVFFHSNGAAIIKGPISGIRASHSWNLWNPQCGSLNENSRCGKVRNGVFAWNGTYEIKFDGMFRIRPFIPVEIIIFFSLMNPFDAIHFTIFSFQVIRRRGTSERAIVVE